MVIRKKKETLKSKMVISNKLKNTIIPKQNLPNERKQNFLEVKIEDIRKF